MNEHGLTNCHCGTKLCGPHWNVWVGWIWQCHECHCACTEVLRSSITTVTHYWHQSSHCAGAWRPKLPVVA